MPTIDRMTGSAAPRFVDALQASGNDPLRVPRPLFRLLASAGITAPGDVDRLTEEQLARMCENKTPEQRLEIKCSVMSAGLYPRTLRTHSPVR
jgi:hypothetical protein